MAIRRSSQIRAASLLLRPALRLWRKKGYRQVLGQSRARLVDLWARFGFRPLEGAEAFSRVTIMTISRSLPTSWPIRIPSPWTRTPIC